MEIYIVRHGETPHNVTKTYSLRDEDLTELGINQAKELKKKIKDIDFDIVICSPLLRCKHTANIITNNKEIHFDDRLKERNCGNLVGKSSQEIDREEYWNYFSNIENKTHENIVNFFKRIYSFLDDLTTKDYNKVLIVSNSGVARAFEGYFNGIQDGYFLKRGLENCEIKVYKVTK